MSKNSLKKWAAVAEIIGTAGLIVSLLFVAHSVNRNSELVKSAHSTLMFELSTTVVDEQIADGGYAVFSAKRSYGLEFQDENEAKTFYSLLRFLTHWELLINRHDDGLLSDNEHSEWSEYYRLMIVRDMDIGWWDATKSEWDQSLADAVDAAFAEK
jgi:hypothetical protein